MLEKVWGSYPSRKGLLEKPGVSTISIEAKPILYPKLDRLNHQARATVELK